MFSTGKQKLRHFGCDSNHACKLYYIFLSLLNSPLNMVPHMKQKVNYLLKLLPNSLENTFALICYKRHKCWACYDNKLPQPDESGSGRRGAPSACQRVMFEVLLNQLQFIGTKQGCKPVEVWAEMLE